MSTSSGFTLVVTGDSILHHRISTSVDPAFREVVELLRATDVVHTQLEMLLHDWAGPETYPSAEGAWSWMRGPSAAAHDLRWCGVDIVSTPNNHSFDYSYGGLRETWRALDEAGLVHAGTGEDLAAARAPAFLDAPHGRIALVSACSSFPAAARAGAARHDMQGRPGVNPLRFLHRVDAVTAGEIVALSRKLGYWATQAGDELIVNPPGLHNTLWRYRVSDAPGVTTVCDEDDLAGNLASIRLATALADLVVAHVHTHEWDLADGRVCTSPAFVEQYARAAIDAGAALVVVQGSHAPMRGIEIHAGRPILYDPGDLFRVGRSARQPADFYLRPGYGPEARLPEASVADGYKAREAVFGWGGGTTAQILSPREVYGHDPGFVIPVCRVDASFRVAGLTLHPAVWLHGSRLESGLPALARGAKAAEILAHVAGLSRPYGTTITIEGDLGIVELPGRNAQVQQQTGSGA